MHTFFFMIAMLLILAACSYQKDITESEAIRIAEAKVNGFAVERKIQAKDFRRLRVHFDTDVNLWQIDFEHAGKEGLLVTILVKKDGSPELTYTAK
jgi:hypothetical protein